MEAGMAKPSQNIRLLSRLPRSVGFAFSPVMDSGTSTSGKASRWRSIQSLLISAPRQNIPAMSANVKLPQPSIGITQDDQGTEVSGGSPSQNQSLASSFSSRSHSGTLGQIECCHPLPGRAM